jgi:hypothetical protein
MGTYAAQCMHNAMAAEDDRLEAGLNFELFTHVTRFYGKKVMRWECCPWLGMCITYSAISCVRCSRRR